MDPDSTPQALDYLTPVKPAESKLENLLATFNSTRSRYLLFQIVGMIGAVALAWMILSAILSLFNFWIILAMVAGLAGYVFFREHQQKEREWRILQGYCADCGYDLGALPQRCPECGRDASLDEPIWRKTRRQLEAKLLADATGEPLVSVVPVTSKIAVTRVATRRPDPIDDAPIPLEPLPGEGSVT